MVKRTRARAVRIHHGALALLLVAACAGGAVADTGDPDSLTATDLLPMAQSLQGSDPDTVAARALLAEQISGNFLCSEAATRTVSPETWRGLVAAIGEHLSPAERKTWARELHAGFVPAQGEPAIAGGRLLVVADTLDRLRYGKLGEVMAQVDPALAAAPLSADNMQAVSRLYLKVKDRAKARQWAQRAYDAALGDEASRLKSGSAGLLRIARLMDAVALTGKDKEYPEFASALVDLAGGGALQRPTYFNCLESAVARGSMLLAPQCRQSLYPALVGEGGLVRCGVSETLAWAHQRSGTSSAWWHYISSKIASTSGDAEASWLLARAYAARAAAGGADPFAGKEWLTQALAAAESDEMRLYVVERIAMGYAFVCRKQKGESFLAGVESQFAGHAEAFAEVRDRFVSMVDDNIGWAGRKAAGREARKAARHRRALRLRLAAAQRRGETLEIQRCRQLLSSAAE